MGIDSLADKSLAATMNLGPWATYTPSLTSLTLGNGTLTGSYVQIGKFVAFRCHFTFGSTSSISGSPSFGLPITAVSTQQAGATALISDSGTTYPEACNAAIATSLVTLRAVNCAGTYLALTDMNATVPWTWAVGDTIDVAGIYEAA